jgi:hypothetical protein
MTKTIEATCPDCETPASTSAVHFDCPIAETQSQSGDRICTSNQVDKVSVLEAITFTILLYLCMLPIVLYCIYS